MKKYEKHFNTEVVRSLNHYGAWAYKIPDMPMGVDSTETRFNPEKPCDIIGIYKGTGFLIEGKQLRDPKAFGMSAMRDSQIDHLNWATDKGNKCFIFLNINVAPDYKLLIFKWATFRKCTKPIPWPLLNDLLDEPHHMLQFGPRPSNLKLVFDLREFLGGL